jgi:putative endonuclease
MLNRRKGKFGEEYAATYLKNKGYKLLKKNWTMRWGELDLICKKGQEIVFVEVKFRTSDRYGHGYEAIDFRKKKKLFRSIQRYLLLNNLQNTQWRLDIICVTRVSKKLQVDHYKNIGFS